MNELSLLSQVSLYVLMGFMGLLCLIIWGWQIKVLRGHAMKNPDGSSDSWKEQKTHFGIAFADIILACPVNIVGIIFVFLSPRWGFYLLTLVSFWWVWANIMTTATSVRFERPRLTINWIIVFPFGILVGLAYIVWTIVHFDFINSL